MNTFELGFKQLAKSSVLSELSSLNHNVSYSLAPEQGDSFAYAHIIVVEVAKTSKGNCRQEEEPHIGKLDLCVSVDIVC